MPPLPLPPLPVPVRVPGAVPPAPAAPGSPSGMLPSVPVELSPPIDPVPDRLLDSLVRPLPHPATSHGAIPTTATQILRMSLLNDYKRRTAAISEPARRRVHATAKRVSVTSRP